MAKSKKEEVIISVIDPSVKKSFAKGFLAKHKINDYATTLEESKFSNVTDWISSGSYSLNRVLSGSYNKGFANNRLYVVAGPSGAGKTLVAGITVKHAQRKGYTVAYFDSENAIDKESMERMGVDVSEIIYIPIKTITEFRNSAIDMMHKWRAEPETKDQPLLMICDSLGGMMGSKEANDIAENKTASDMGQRAKELRSTARALTVECAHNMIPLICTNHTYEQAAANPMSAPITKMTGGEGFMYAASAVIYLKKRAERKADHDQMGVAVKTKTGNILIATSQKNRFVPEGTTGEIYLDFEKGISPYYGLINDALEFGFIEKRGTRLYVKHLDKSFFETTVYTKEVFAPFIEELNKKVEEKYKFSTLANDDVDFSEALADETIEKTEEIKDVK